jgi:hypothetical protein
VFLLISLVDYVTFFKVAFSHCRLSPQFLFRYKMLSHEDPRALAQLRRDRFEWYAGSSSVFSSDRRRLRLRAGATAALSFAPKVNTVVAIGAAVLLAPMSVSKVLFSRRSVAADPCDFLHGCCRKEQMALVSSEHMGQKRDDTRQDLLLIVKGGLQPVSKVLFSRRRVAADSCDFLHRH